MSFFCDRFLCRCLASAVLLALFTQPTLAGKINLILSDSDSIYRGDSQILQDAVAAVGGNLEPTEADELESTVFEHDGAIVDVMIPSESSMYLDLQLIGFPNLLDLTTNAPVTIATTGFGLDWFSSNGFYLRLKIDTVDVLLTNGVFFFTTEAAVLDQALPFDLQLPEMVSVSFTATSPAVQAGSTTTLATASGAVTISGQAVFVPEPVAASLCVLVLVASFGCTRRSL